MDDNFHFRIAHQPVKALILQRQAAIRRGTLLVAEPALRKRAAQRRDDD
ncbi:hypothetical protein [Enterobacter sp.]|nr:hypothetical protein [Enterobacter sp.]